jgi:hypothetical protein
LLFTIEKVANKTATAFEKEENFLRKNKDLSSLDKK